MCTFVIYLIKSNIGYVFEPVILCAIAYVLRLIPQTTLVVAMATSSFMPANRSEVPSAREPCYVRNTITMVTKVQDVPSHQTPLHLASETSPTKSADGGHATMPCDHRYAGDVTSMLLSVSAFYHNLKLEK